MTECMQSRQHQYIFEPVCASVLLRRNATKEPLRSRHAPRIEGQVQLEPMALRLSQVCTPAHSVSFLPSMVILIDGGSPPLGGLPSGADGFIVKLDCHS